MDLSIYLRYYSAAGIYFSFRWGPFVHSLEIVQWDSTRRDHPGNLGGVSGSGPVIVMKEVVRKEVLKWLNAGFIYAISDSSWVSPVHVVPKKGRFIVIRNERNELIPTRTVTRSRVCIDYRKLNTATINDHFPLPFIDHMLDRLPGHPHFCFLDGYSRCNQIAIAPED